MLDDNGILARGLQQNVSLTGLRANRCRHILSVDLVLDKFTAHEGSVGIVTNSANKTGFGSRTRSRNCLIRPFTASRLRKGVHFDRFSRLWQPLNVQDAIDIDTADDNNMIRHKISSN